MQRHTTICKISGTFSELPSKFKEGDIVWHDTSDTYSYTDYKRFIVTKAYTIRNCGTVNPWFYVIQDLGKKYTISNVSEEYLFREKPKN